jgi:phosphohistidine phosphatase
LSVNRFAPRAWPAIAQVMDRLILLRHGKAEPDSVSGDDFDRRLAPRGVRESTQMAERLAEMGFVPDLALVSLAARTRETWAAAQAVFPDAEARFERSLYLAETATVRRLAEGAGAGARTVMVVGHNPGLRDLTLKLLLEAAAPDDLVRQAQARFPPASASVFLIHPQGRPAFDGLFYPGR